MRSGSTTLTMTSCKRYDLFERTVDSFLACCSDHDRIERWICVDDNSSEADRARMRERYPFFEYIWKGPDQRGHGRSMNVLRELIAERPTEFVLHLEDDWEFFQPAPLIGDAEAILRHDERLGQVLFNRNYAEVNEPGDPFVGGIPVDGVAGEHPAYVVHEHYRPNSPEYDAFYERVGARANHAYWPHYSLRPSVLRSAVWRELGPFEETPNMLFELYYASRYRDAGWRSAFFPGIVCRHIGRLTTERAPIANLNAYERNRAAPARSVAGDGIPRTIHQIWLGPHPPPTHIETWRTAHPDWEHRLWTEATIRWPLVNQAQFDAMDELCGKADILRYELLHRHGGVYLDADFECLQPLPESLLDDPCFTAFESEDYRPGVVGNAVIGAQPGHPILSAMLIVVGRLDPAELPGQLAAYTTGTFPFTRVVHANAGMVRVHPSGLFYPEHYEGPGRNDVSPIARHHWASLQPQA